MQTIPVTTGLFTCEADGSGRLIGGFCAACRRYHFPRLATCPYCSAADCTERLLSDRGTLYLFTTVTSRPPGGYRGSVPFAFGVVELPEGLRVISRLTEPDFGRLHFGQRMRLVLTPLHTDDEGRQVISYAFAPVEA